MATTKIFPITATEAKALAYIANPDKTNNGRLILTSGCSEDPYQASHDFEEIRKLGTGLSTVLSQHFIQSFAPGEITPELALQVGKEMCERFLKGEYQYFLAVHNDRDHIHLHVIFNNVNQWNGRTFETIIKAGLSENEAEMYVIESNVMQRGFENLRISEQAAAVALRHNEMFSQGKRNDILRELELLENPNAETEESTLTPVGSKLDSGKTVGAEYGVSKGSVIRLIRINKLIDELKALVDSGDIAIRTGVELSFLSEATQAVVAECADDGKIDIKTAKMLRASAESDGYIDRDTVHDLIYSENSKPVLKPRSVKISNDTYVKYFRNGTKPKEIAETIEKALEFYFKNNT